MSYWTRGDLRETAHRPFLAPGAVLPWIQRMRRRQPKPAPTTLTHSTPTAGLRALNRQLAQLFNDELPSARPTVCMFVRNTVEHDARVDREIEALTDAGLSVVVFAVARTPEAGGLIERPDCTVVRVYDQAVRIRLMLDLLLNFQRTYWRKSRQVWKAIKKPLKSTATAFNRTARELDKKQSARPLGPLQAVFAPVLRGTATGLLRASRTRPGRPPLLIPPIQKFRKVVQKAVWPMFRLMSAFHFVRVTGPMAARLQPVAYHCHDENVLFAAARARRRWPAPVIYDAHELYPHRNRPRKAWWKTWLFERADRYYSRRADALITVSHAIARHMERRYGVAHVDVVMNIPDIEPPTAANQQDPAHGSPVMLNFDHIPRPRLFYCGNVTFNRGLEESVRALEFLPTCSLIIMGPDRANFFNELHDVAASVGVQDRVHFYPPVPHEQVVRTAAMADIGLVLIKPACLSYAYSLPNKMFECMHANLPVVAADLPELRRVVNQHGVGMLCDQEDPRSIASAVKAIIESPQTADEMRARAGDAALLYTWENERDILLGIYRQLGVLDALHEAVEPSRRLPAVSAASFVVDREAYCAHNGRRPIDSIAVDSLRQPSMTFLHAQIAAHLPPMARVAIVSRGDDQLLLGMEGAGHFPQTDTGIYSGYHPADSHEALVELTKVFERGYEYVAFPGTSLWWLDHYEGLRSHLMDYHELVVRRSGRNDSCMIFRLLKSPEEIGF